MNVGSRVRDTPHTTISDRSNDPRKHLQIANIKDVGIDGASAYADLGLN